MYEMLRIRNDEKYKELVIETWHTLLYDWEMYQEAIKDEPVSTTFGSWIRHHHFKT